MGKEQILRIPIKYGELFQTMNNEEAGKLLKALFIGKDEGLDGLTLTYFNIIIVDINNLHNSVTNGRKGGRPKKERGVIENKKGGFEKVEPIESKIKEIKVNKEKVKEINNYNIKSPTYKNGDTLEDIKKELEFLKNHWNKMFDRNYKFTEDLLDSYKKLRKKYSYQDIKDGFNNYVDFKKQRDGEGFKTEFTLTILAFLTQKKNGIINYL